MPDTPDALVEHTSFVRSVARAVLRGDDLVEDVVQDTMVTAIEEAHRRRGPLRAWLGGVARNKARDVIRRRTARRRREERASRGEATDGVDELVARAEEGRRLVAAVLGLGELYRKPILLRYYEGLPPREIAKRLDVPVETARTRIKRGIEKLRAELGHAHQDEAGGWRVALLPLLHLPSRSPGPEPILITGGVMLGKKGIVWAALLLVLVGGGLWLRPWADDDGRAGQDEGATLTSDEVDPKQPRLRGLPAEADRPSTEWPAPIDFAQVDRDRDLHGWVVRDDGSPVAGASVTALSYPWRTLGVLTSYGRMLSSEKGPSSVSGVDGSFSLSLARGDLVHLRVRARGFAPMELTHLQAGERVRVVLAEAVRLIVNATDADGRPVVGMPVRLFVNPERTGHWLETTATTGTDGRAVFAHLPPSLKGWIDPAPHREGFGNPGWVSIELPASGEEVHRLQLAVGKTLRGRVLHSGTGAPIEGARVSTNWALLPSVRTDAEGKYVLHGWTKELRNTLHATAPGFVQSAIEFTDAGVPDIGLRPGMTLRGRVVDVMGEVVAGALVNATRIGGGASPSMGSAVTDGEGHFVVEGLDWPAKILVVRSTGRGRLVQVIAHGAKEDLGDLVLPARCEVTGILTDPAGAPMARIPVTLTPSEGFGRALRRLERWTDDLGRFRFPDLGPAAYDLVVGPRFEPLLRKGVELTSEQPTVDLRLSPDSARSVVVRAVDEAGKPAVGVYVWANATHPTDRKQGKTGEDGTLTLELFRRPYKLSVVPTVGLAFALPTPIELDASQTRADFTLERLVAIRGHLVTPDGKPIVRGFIRVDGDGDKPKWIYTDAKGDFVARVSAGARVSLAFKGNVEEPKTSKVQFIPYTARVDDVAAGAEGLVLRAVALDTNRTLTIRLVDPAGKPIEGVSLQISLPSNKSRLARTGADGRAEWSGLPAVALKTMMGMWPGPTRERPWIIPHFPTVTPKGQELTVKIIAGTALEGTVLKEDGSPGAHAVVHILEGGKLVRGVLADAEGRFLAILDPKFKGQVQLRCKATASGGKFSAVAEVQPGQAPVTLRLEPKK